MAPHSSEFALAMQAADKAWYGTPMLARARQSKGDELQALLRNGTPGQWGAYLTEVAGPSFASYAVTHGMDACKAEQLGRLILEMAWEETPPAGDGEDPAEGLRRLEMFSLTLQRWIDDGSAQSGSELAMAGSIVGHPEQRLALMAPLASALGVCLVMSKAMLSGYPVGVPA